MGDKLSFIGWATDTANMACVQRALACIKRQLTARGYEYVDWRKKQGNRNVGLKVQAAIGSSDLVVLEGSTNSPNISFEAGFASALDIPLAIFKQRGTRALPEDYGGPEYAEYPTEIDDVAGFEAFERKIAELLVELGCDVLSEGHRKIRRSRLDLFSSVAHFADAYRIDHPSLHLMSGWIDALANEIRSGGATELKTHPSYYLPSFAKLRNWAQGQIRAIADLTDETESFWKPQHPEDMSTRVSERIFLVDWSWLFERQLELSRHIDTWAKHKRNHQERSYDVYVATKEELATDEAHPLRQAVGYHLLLIEPDVTGGYVSHAGDPESRRLVIARDQLLYDTALHFYNSVKRRAIKFEPDKKLINFKRDWLTANGVGAWESSWTNETEYRPSRYFELYDRHIRCWIPHYSQMLRLCADAIAGEVMRVTNDSSDQVDILELGFGTGGLTGQVLAWAQKINQPFDELSLPVPIRNYDAVDRAEQMVRIAHRAIRPDRHPSTRLRLLNRTAWHGLDRDNYGVIFGSLILHFLAGSNADNDSLEEFFENCATRARTNASLVFADIFGSDEPDSERAIIAWREWMTVQGLSDAVVDAFIAGNPDMTGAPSVQRLDSAARKQGFFLSQAKPVSDRTLPFRITIFQRQ